MKSAILPLCVLVSACGFGEPPTRKGQEARAETVAPLSTVSEVDDSDPYTGGGGQHVTGIDQASCHGDKVKQDIMQWFEDRKMFLYNALLFGVPNEVPEKLRGDPRFQRYINLKQKYCSSEEQRMICISKTTDPPIEEDFPEPKKEASELFDAAPFKGYRFFVLENYKMSDGTYKCIGAMTLEVEGWEFPIDNPSITFNYTVNRTPEGTVNYKIDWPDGQVFNAQG